MKFGTDVFTKSWYGKGEFWCANLKEENHLEDQEIEGVDFLCILFFKLFAISP